MGELEQQEKEQAQAQAGLDEGPYGLRGKDTPPLQNMLGGYAIIFAAVVIIPLVLFIVIRFFIL